MSDNASVSREECQMAIRGEEELRSFNSRKSERDTQGFLERLACAHLALLDSSEQTIAELRGELAAAQRTVELLSKTELSQCILDALRDVQSGRTRSLSCVEGGCERDTLRSRLVQAQKDTERVIVAAIDLIDASQDARCADLRVVVSRMRKAINVASGCTRASGTIDVTLEYAGRAKPTPIPDAACSEPVANAQAPDGQVGADNGK